MRKGLTIGLSGKFGSGKDTAATLLEEALPNMGWKRISFALALKRTVAAMTGTTLEQNLSDEGKQLIPLGFQDSLGTLQQKVGTTLRTHMDEMIWVRAAFAGIAPEDNVLITDVRFPNELWYVLGDCGGFVIRLEGRAPRAGEMRDPNHASEVSLDKHLSEMEVVRNDGSLDELRERLLRVVAYHVKLRLRAREGSGE